MRAASLSWAFVLLAGAFAGCLGGSKSSPDVTDAPPSQPEGGLRTILEGFVWTSDVLPVPQATVTVTPGDKQRATDERGAYRFENLDAGDYVLTVAREGYREAQQRASVRDGFSTLVNFTLEEVRLQTPHHETTPFVGQIACHATVGDDPETGTSQECGQWDPVSQSAHAFEIAPGAVQVQVEAFWTPATAAARNLTVKVETVGLGGLDAVFAHQSGESGMKVVVSEGNLRKYYATGGKMRVTMTSGPSLRVDPVPAGVGVAFQQPFEVDLTTFFGEPGAADFTYRP